MNLVNILVEPYFIIILISIIITIISYFIILNEKVEDNKNTDIAKKLLIVFITSFIILIISKFIISYMNKNNFFQKGGKINIADRLTIVSDDIDIGLLDN
jgi:uncharacterized membrane protein YdjX (TVP38/TMEM64 family)